MAFYCIGAKTVLCSALYSGGKPRGKGLNRTEERLFCLHSNMPPLAQLLLNLFITSMRPHKPVQRLALHPLVSSDLAARHEPRMEGAQAIVRKLIDRDDSNKIPR